MVSRSNNSTKKGSSTAAVVVVSINGTITLAILSAISIGVIVPSLKKVVIVWLSRAIWLDTSLKSDSVTVSPGAADCNTVMA